MALVMDWGADRRDEDFYQALESGQDALAVLAASIVLSRYAPGQLERCPASGESFGGFPPPAEGVALIAAEALGIDELGRRRALRDFAARQRKLALARWLGHRSRCVQQGWRCGRMEVQEALDKMGRAPSPAERTLPSATVGFVAGAAVGAALSTMVKK